MVGGGTIFTGRLPAAQPSRLYAYLQQTVIVRHPFTAQLSHFLFPHSVNALVTENVHPPRTGSNPPAQSVESYVMNSTPNGQAMVTETMEKLFYPHGVIDLIGAEVVFRDGAKCALSRREAGLLAYLASKPGMVVSRDELLIEVWKLDPARLLTRTVDMHLSNLRRKLRDNAKNPVLLQTVNRHGYRLASPSDVR